ncbi:MAG: divalent-cation tolerance protein CutA [Verrucomicrobia bacterium]|nr:MAG: divalent-cation tolerance protein CutA [Verrucomicrobiota bacterium]
MQTADAFCVVLVTAPNLDAARLLARKAVEGRLAACVNIVPAIESHYWWEGKVHHDPESLLLIKTTRDRLAALEEVLLAAHPYDTPEIVALPMAEGTPRYLAWLADSVRPSAGPGEGKLG